MNQMKINYGIYHIQRAIGQADMLLESLDKEMMQGMNLEFPMVLEAY
mgnify:FL=1